MTASSAAGFPHSDVNGSMPACGSPLLFAACHVLLRRMVPGHPPCALCSLIFSSLDPETNCFALPASVPPLPRFPFGLQLAFFESLLLSLCGCQGAGDRALKTIQNQVRRKLFSEVFPVTLPLPLLTFSLRIQLAISVAFSRTPFAFRLPSSDRPGIGFRVSTSAFSLERR